MDSRLLDKKNWPSIAIPGLAVDIDETLSWTIGFWIEAMQEKFGNPENLTVKEMVEKYRYTQNVPYWQSSAALEWMADKINSNQTQEGLPLIDDNPKLLIFLNENYQGKVFLYDHRDNLGFSFATACQDWPTVYEEVKKAFAKI